MKRQSCTRWTAIAVLIMVVASCEQEPLQLQKSEGADCEGCADRSSGDGTIGLPPDISYFSPKGGNVGSTVTINGSKFSATPSYNIVKFNGAQATVTSATTVKLVVTVPCGATSGKISVSVSGLSDISTSDFTVQPPTIGSFSPQSGIIGTTVTISGTGFCTTPSANVVTFGGVPATVISATNTTLIVSVPCGAASGVISVGAGELEGFSASDFTVQPPTIGSFSPQSGIIGTAVTISGTGFCTTPSANMVAFDGVPATVISATNTALVVSVPAGATSGKISVTIGGLQVVSATDFQVIDIPLDGLVAFYPFDGNAKDISSNQLHGTVYGATLSTDRSGSNNKAYSFDGLNDYISVGNPTALQITNTITLSVWVRSTAFTNQLRILSKTQATNASHTEGHGYELHLGAIGETPFYSAFIHYPGSGTYGLNYASGVPYSANEWVNITFTIDGYNVKWYKNGDWVQTQTNHQPLTAAALGDFEIGKMSNVNDFLFNGLIDDVAVYNRTLSDEEVMKLYQQNILQ